MKESLKDSLRECDECGYEWEWDNITNRPDRDCPECGNQLIFFAGPSRGGCAEKLGEKMITADDEEERDIYRAFLHLLACGLVSNKDMFEFFTAGSNETLTRALNSAIEESNLKEDGNRVLVCPSCDEEINAWEHWFHPDDDRGDFFEFAV
jgi:predicted RNA-binding Zn-ribbon protein involved in translation (DUF1610 family)